MKTHKAVLELRLHNPCGLLEDELIATYDSDLRGQRICQRSVDLFRMMAESDPDVLDNLIVVRNVATIDASEEAAR